MKNLVTVNIFLGLFIRQFQKRVKISTNNNNHKANWKLESIYHDNLAFVAEETGDACVGIYTNISCNIVTRSKLKTSL